MMRTAILVGALSALASTASWAASEEVLYGNAPDWTVPVPALTDGATPPGATVRLQYQDFQIFAGPNGDELFTATRMSILRPDGLAAGNIRLAWSPDSGDATMHYLRIVRDGQVIDVLESTKFQVLRREENLEDSMLSGRLTAVLQVPGLRVGDDLEFAATVRRKDLTLGEHSSGYVQLPPLGVPGAYRARIVWPESRNLNWKVSADVPPLQEASRGAMREVNFELRDPASSIETRGAPARFNVRRLIEYSDFASWSELSARVWPLFNEASQLPSDSPVRQEIARIAAETTEPARRIEAALQVVQDKIRYVYVGMDGSNMTPASIADTWERRFGDCKAKTVLLLAMLRELGIRAEAVLVHSGGGDGLNERLPMPGFFDHVLVRAWNGEIAYWLDGTRRGDKWVGGLPPNMYRWVLPLSKEGADIRQMPMFAAVMPQSITVLEWDASSGFDARIPMKAQSIIRGDTAYDLQAQLAAMAPADAERAIRNYWEQFDNSVEADSASWKYDDKGKVLSLSVAGTTRVDWKGDDDDGRRLEIPGAGFSPPAEYRRPREQDQTAPWALEYPANRCWATAIHLPPATDKWKWDYRAKNMDQKLGGVTYRRIADMRDGVVRTVMSRRVDTPEISAEEARQTNEMVPSFDNNISDVIQIAADEAPARHPFLSTAPFGPDTDWMSPATPCMRPVVELD